MGRPPAIMRLCCAQAYALRISLSRADGLKRDQQTDPAGDARYTADARKLPLALAPATGCNSLQNCPPGLTTAGNAIRRRRMHGTIEQPGIRICGPRATRPTRCRWRFRRRPSRTVPDRFVLAVFRPAAPGRSGALLQGQHVRAVLVGDQIQRHHGHRNQSRGVLVGGLARRHHHPRRRTRPAPRKLHRDGPAAPQRAAQDRGADVHADPSRPARDQHPQALGRMPRQSAEERDVRLGRQGLDRTDHADAGRAVRLPLGGPPQADALVRRRHHPARPRRRRRHRRRAPGRADGMRARISAGSGRSGSTSRRRATCCR